MQRTAKHAATLAALFPNGQLQGIAFHEPSILMRSTSVIQRNLRCITQLTGCSMQAALDLVARRPSLLSKSPRSLGQSFNALSVWHFSTEDKLELITSHPLLLRLSPREVHSRCRWLRDLMMSNGYYHSVMRELPVGLLGVMLMHLPSAWSRLQFLADSSKESKMDVMQVVQCSKPAFAAAFPEHEKWLHWRTTEMVR